MFHLRTRREEYEMVNVGNKLYMLTDLERTKERATIAVLCFKSSRKRRLEKKVQLTFLMCCRSKEF